MMKGGAGKDGMFSPEELLRKMFESGTGDWEMIGSDGQAVKFHQLVLSVQVPYFRALFSHGSTLECVNKRIVIPAEMEISGEAVKAFLRYVYYKDAKGMRSSFKITCALIRLAHFYNIPALVETANDIVRVRKTKKPDWFSVEDLWSLYQHVRLWEEEHRSKNKLMANIVAVIKTLGKQGPPNVLVPITTTSDPVIVSELMVALCPDFYYPSSTEDSSPLTSDSD